MSCVVKCCKNRSDQKKKNPGITFHRFPIKNIVWRNDWVQIIRKCNSENHWIPNKFSVICSVHFESKDLYTTKGGSRRLVTYAVPQNFLFEYAAAPAEVQPDSVPNMFMSNESKETESAQISVPALGQPCSSTMALQQEEQHAEPYMFINLEENAPVIVQSFNQLSPSSVVIKQVQQPTKSSIFSDKQEKKTKNLKSGSVISPRMSPCESVEDFEQNLTDSDSAMSRCDLEACRVCFASGCKLYPMTAKLNKAYKMLTGFSNDDHLPPYLCTECAHRLMNYVRFRARSLRARLVMLEVTKKHEDVTLESIKSIAGENIIGTKLSIKHNETDLYDLEIEHDEEKAEMIVSNIKVEDDTAGHNDEYTGEDMVYVPEKPDYDPEREIKDEEAEMDFEDNVNYVYVSVDNNQDVEINEIKLEITPTNISEDDGNRPSLDENTAIGDMQNREIKQEIIDENVCNYYDKDPVKVEEMAVENNTLNNYKVNDEPGGNNSNTYVYEPGLSQTKSVKNDLSTSSKY